MNGRGPALAIACALGAGAVHAESLVLEMGKTVLLACTTHAVVVAPEAASTNGTFRITLSAKDQTGADRTGTWSVADVTVAHTGSLAARFKDLCAAGCPLNAPTGKPLELWAPVRAGLGSQPAGSALTLAALKPDTMKFSASTFIDKEVAALEQGECTVAP